MQTGERPLCITFKISPMKYTHTKTPRSAVQRPLCRVPSRVLIGPRERRVARPNLNQNNCTGVNKQQTTAVSTIIHGIKKRNRREGRRGKKDKGVHDAKSHLPAVTEYKFPQMSSAAVTFSHSSRFPLINQKTILEKVYADSVICPGKSCVSQEYETPTV